MARATKDELQESSGAMDNFESLTRPKSPFQINADAELQDTLIQVVLDDFEKAKTDRDSHDYGISSKGDKLSFDKWMEELGHLYSGYREPKDLPWKFCSNRSLRIATAILEMLHSRLFAGVWNEDLTRWRPGEINDVNKVERITKFMDWWVRVWSPMREFIDNWSKVTAGYGDSLTETCWDVEERDSGDVQEIPINDESGQPLINQDGTPAVQKISVPKRFERTVSRIIPKKDIYLMKDSKDIQNDVVVIEEEIPYKKLEALERKGHAINVSDKLAEKLIVPIPPNVTDPIEREKIRRVKMRNMPVKVLRWYGHYDTDGVGFDQSVHITICRDYQLYLSGIRMRDVTKSGKRPLEFTKYASYLDRIDQLIGEGVLDQVKELAEEIDAIFNQMTDANTLSVLKPGFYDPSGDLDAPAIKIAPNRMTPVSDPSRNVYFPPYEVNTDRLINAIRLVIEFIERLTAASSYVMGKESEIVGGSGTATRTTAIIQNAEIRFTRPIERLKASAARILTNVLDLVQLNIPPGMENRVLGEDGEPLFHTGELSEEGISGQFDAYILNDPTLGSKQTERELASMLYSILLQNVLVGTDATKIYKVTADLLKAHGKDPEEYLGPEPDMDSIDSPEDENTLMLQGDFGRVRANMSENHILHLQKHMELINSPTFQQLAQVTPALAQQVQQYAMTHIQEHQMQMQAMMGLMQKIGGSGGGQSNPGEKSNKPGENRTEASGVNADPNRGLENIAGPMGQALNTQRNGTQKPPSQPVR